MRTDHTAHASLFHHSARLLYKNKMGKLKAMATPFKLIFSIDDHETRVQRRRQLQERADCSYMLDNVNARAPARDRDRQA